MEELMLLVAGIAMGFGLCLALWGPFLLPYIAGTKRKWSEGLKISLIFSLGRLLALAILGGLASVAFAELNWFFPPHRSGYIYIIIAILIILIGIFVALGKGFKFSFYQIIRQRVFRGTEGVLILSFLIGISPCAPLIAILTYIGYTATNVLQGIIYALSFGIGTTVPVLILGTLAGFLPDKIFKSDFHLNILRISSGIIIIGFGIHLFYSVLMLF